MRPGVIGGANWGGGAFDPATGMLYVKTTSNNAAILRLAEPDRSPSNPRADEVDAPLINRAPQATFSERTAAAEAAVWPSHGDRSQSRRDRLARHARRHAVAAHASALKDVAVAREARRCRRARRHRDRRRLVFVGGGDEALNAVDATTGESCSGVSRCRSERPARR